MILFTYTTSFLSKDNLIRDVNKEIDVFNDDLTFSFEKFNKLIIRNNLYRKWPRMKTGNFTTNKKIIKQHLNNEEIEKFNEQLDFNRNQFNTQNSNLIEQSNVTWRRNLNTANTAGENAVNQANAMNSFNLSNQGLSFLWQEMRDAAKWEYDSSNNEADRKANLTIAALGNESVSDTAKVNNLKTIGEFAYKLWKG